MTIVILIKLQQELQFSAIWLSHHNYFDVLFITYLLQLLYQLFQSLEMLTAEQY